MPNEKLQGLTLEMTLDSIGVQEGMKGLKRQLGVVNSEMKANLSAFDKLEKSMKQYQTRIDGLNTKLTVQKKMHQQAKQELKDLNDSYKKSGIEIKKVETQLSKLTDEHKKNDQALKKSNDEIKKSNDNLKKARMQQKVVNDEKAKAKEKLDQLRQAEKQLRDSGKASTEQMKKSKEATKQQRLVHQGLVEQYKKERTNVKQLSDSHKVLKIENDKVKQSFNKSNSELKQSQNQHNKLNKEIQDYTKNQAEATKKINNEKISLNNLEKAIEKTSNEMKLFNKEQALANSHFTKTADKFDKMSDSVGRFGMGMQSVGRNMSMYVTTPIVGALGASTKAVIDFDSAMAGVNKTVDLSSSEYKKMSDDIVNMSKKLPVATTDIAAVAESAGQLGIKKSAILDFTKTVIDLGESTNLTREQAATEFARFANIVDMPQKSFDRLGSSIVALGNTTATTEAEIMSMSMRIAAQGKLVNMSESDITALAATMSSLGIEAEAGGTAMTTVLKKIDKAVGAGGKEIKAFSDASGVSAKEFKKQWESDPIQALDTFIGGLSESKKEGKNLSEILADLGIKGIRESDTILRMANNHKLLGQSVKTSGKAWKENKALTKEANQRYKTMASQIQVFKNQLVALGIDIGNHVAPTVVGITKTLGKWTESFQKLPKPMKSVSIGLGLIAAATGPVLLATGLLIRGIGSAMKGYAGLNRVMAKNSVEAGVNAAAQSTAGTAMMTTNSKGAKASKGIGNLSNVFGIGTKSIKSFGGMLLKGVKGFGPWGLALTAVTTGLGIAYKKVDWFRNGVNGAGEVIKTFSSGIGGTLLTSVKYLGNWVGDLGTKFKETWEKSKQGKDATKDYEKLKSATKSVFDELSKGNKKATDTVNVLGKGVSKGTKKALGEYVKLSEGTIKEFEKVKINGGKINKETQNDLSTSIYQTGKEASKVVKERAQEIQNNLKKALSYSDSLSDEDKQNIIIRSNKAGKVKLEKVNALNDEINKLTMEAYQDGKISPEEQKLIQKKEEARNKLVIGYATKGEAERQAILSRMKYNAEGLSNKEISKALKEAYKIEEDEIKKAAEKRDKALQAANASLKDKSINKNEHRSLVLDIESEYNDAVDKAKKKSGEVRDTVKKGNKDISKEMDLSNGHVYTGAEKLWENFVADFKKYWGSGTAVNDTLNSWQKGFTDTINGWHDGYVKKASKIGYDIIDWIGRGLSSSYKKNKEALTKVGTMIWSPVKTGWKSTTKWVSGATDKSKNWLKKVKVKSGGLWDDVKSKTNTTFKDLTQKTKTKFSGMYKTSAGWLTKTAGTALGKFTNISNSSTKWLGKATGTAVGSFLKTSKGATKWLGKTAGTAHSKFKSVSKGAGDWLGKTAGTATSRFTSVSKSASKWLSKTAGTAISKFSTVWSNAKDKFSKTSNKAESSTKSVSKSASKWFGKTAGSATSKFGEMWGSARTNFSKVASHGWDKARSTYDGFKKWLGKTLTYIRDIGSDMGRAASDLGIKVANNAITGLNKMIAGVNKISSAITGDNLIGTIDTIGGSGSLGKKLSTGTVNGSVSTDSEGGLKQATMAIVNDKGPGNGTGGFTQEIIERKDGSMFMPKGKDVPVMLEPGSKVHSGGITQQFDKLGLLPRFSTGTPKKKNLWDKLTGKLGSNVGKYGAKLEETAHQSKNKTESAEIGIKSALEAGVKEGASALGHGMGNVMKWIEKPKELVSTMMDKMGVNFSNIPGHTGSLVRGAYSKLLPKIVDKVKDMFSEVEGGDGDASWLLKYPQLQPFGKYVGMTMNGTDNHYGLDFGMPTGTSVKAVTAGTITDASWSPYGGGNQVELKEPGGKWFQWWMHNSKLSVKKGDKVQPGDELAKSGNTGSSSTPHVHIQRMKGYPSNDTAVDPTSWLKSLTGGGSKNKKASAWRGDIVRAARQMGVSVSGSDINRIISLINAESSGNAGAVQSTSLLDINTLMGNPAQGLLQYIPQTFRKYAVKGHTNIKSGFDQLLAFFNNKNWRTQFNPNGGWSPSGPTRYANGGISSTHKIAQISEGNKAEAIVPLTKRTRAIQLTEQIMDYLGMDTGKSNVTVNNDTSVMEKLLKQIVMLNNQNNKLTETLIKTVNSSNNKVTNSKNVVKELSNLMGENYMNNIWNQGGAING